jgi:hypothetical protein
MTISTASAFYILQNVENESLLAKINTNTFAHRVKSNARKKILPFVWIPLWTERNSEILTVQGVKHLANAKVETTSNDVTSLELRWSVYVLVGIVVALAIIAMITPGIRCPTRMVIQRK